LDDGKQVSVSNAAGKEKEPSNRGQAGQKNQPEVREKENLVGRERGEAGDGSAFGSVRTGTG